MVITNATIYDIDGIVECAKRFFDYAGFEKIGLPLDVDSFKKSVISDIANGVVLLLKDGDLGVVRGGISGNIIPWWMNRHIKIMVEKFFWVDEEFRGIQSIKMLKLFEKKCLDLGVKIILMVIVETYLSEKVRKLYERMGYKKLESYYIKILS